MRGCSLILFLLSACATPPEPRPEPGCAIECARDKTDCMDRGAMEAYWQQCEAGWEECMNAC